MQLNLTAQGELDFSTFLSVFNACPLTECSASSATRYASCNIHVKMKIIVPLFVFSSLLFVANCNRQRGENERINNIKANESPVQYINPDGLHKNPAYSQVIVVNGLAKTVYVGGQNAVDASGAVIGKGDLKAQTEQVFKNLQIALEAGGAKLENVVKWNIYVVEGQPIEPGLEVFQRVSGNRPNPPVITTVYVAKLANPDFLVEIDAVAVVP
jgi:enamine deaminase RidA (YjgF/YER057c/UK114 family)